MTALEPDANSVDSHAKVCIQRDSGLPFTR